MGIIQLFNDLKIINTFQTKEFKYKEISKVKKNYKMKKTISMKMFIAEFGENFSEHMKERLMELDIRSVLTRNEDSNVLDLKHVEHIKHKCQSNSENPQDTCEKEYDYGQFLVLDGSLYFSECCIENEKVVQSPVVSEIYNKLASSTAVSESGSTGKLIDDSNIDYLIDTLLTVFPEVSKEYTSIMSKYYNKK